MLLLLLLPPPPPPPPPPPLLLVLLLLQADAERKGQSIKPVSELPGNLNKWDSGAPLKKLHYESGSGSGNGKQKEPPYHSTSAIGQLYDRLVAFRETDFVELLYDNVEDQIIPRVDADPDLAMPKISSSGATTVFVLLLYHERPSFAKIGTG
jgi:hypothetical protein